MPSNAEIAKDTIEQFKKIQDYMILAKEENAVKTYDRLKREYLSLKALLNVIGVNLIDIDTVKEQQNQQGRKCVIFTTLPALTFFISASIRNG